MRDVTVENWEVVAFDEVCDVVSGKNQSAVVSPNGAYPIYGSGGIIGRADDYICEEGTTIIGRKGTINSPIFVPTKFWNVDTAFGLHAKLGVLDKRLLYYFCIRFNFKTLDKSTAVPSLAKGDINKIRFPLPPLPEQRAIVSKIEQLFSELDNGIANLKTAQQQLKVYRQAVLKQAFEGELTNSNVPEGKLPKGWKEKTLGEHYEVYVGATPSRKEPSYWNGNIPWLSSGEVAFCNIHETREKITELGLAKTSTKLHPKGTVMLGMIGEGRTRGQAAILRLEAAHNQNTAAIRIPEGWSSEYLYYFLQFKYETTRKMGSGNNQKALNKSRVSEMQIPIQSTPNEQHQIVQEIESRLSVCDKLEESIAQSLQKAEALRQSILKKAFEGRLLTEEELAACKKEKDWESAGELLKRIKHK